MIQLNSKNQTSINKVLNPICLIFISTRDNNNQIKKLEIYFIKEKKPPENIWWFKFKLVYETIYSIDWYIKL